MVSLFLTSVSCSRSVELIERLRKAFTANGKMKLLLSVFSCSYSRVKIFVFAVNRRYFSIFLCDLLKD